MRYGGFARGGRPRFERPTMKLSKAVELYVQRKQATGLHYTQTTATLRVFARRVGDIPLTSIKQIQISSFLSGRPSSSNNTWLQKYRMLRNFFEYWKFRGQLKTLRMPAPRLRCPRTFRPYVYSLVELQRILRATRFSQSRCSCVIDSFTFRTLLKFLYGTGVLISEALTLLCDDVDLHENVMVLRRRGVDNSRRIPIGRDVHKLLRVYLHSPARKQHQSGNLFLTKSGKAIGYVAVYKGFRRIRRHAGIVRHDGGHYQPRIHDLRCSFAVHRLTAWYKQEINVERMLPALSEYLGEIGLDSMEKYLAMTPERFRNQLCTLSPGTISS